MQTWSGTVKFPVMGFTRRCDFCGAEYVAKRATSRFCCESHRVRNSQSSPAERERRAAVAESDAAGSEVGSEVGADSLADHFRAELVASGQDGTVLGRLALTLAARIDSDRTSDTSRAPLAREFSRLRAEVLRDVPAGDFIDELKLRRDAMIAAAKAEPGDEFLHVNGRVVSPN
jgi:hypothetical protein